MSEQNLSYISRGASLLVVLGVLVGGTLAYAQSVAEIKISVFANKDGKTPVAGIQIQQILTGTGKVKEYCVTDANGMCTFVISEKDGDVHFIGAQIDKETEKIMELYGHEIEPNYGCKQVTFRLNAKVGKIYQYVDGSQKDSVQSTVVFAESFFNTKCVANAKGGYDWVNKDTGAPVMPSVAPTATKENPEKKSPSEPKWTGGEPKKPEISTPDDDYEDVEGEISDDIDIKLTDAILGSKKLQRKKSTNSFGLRFKVAAASNLPDTVIVRAGMDCTLLGGYPNDELWQKWDFKVALFGSQQIFYEFGAEDEKWNALKKKKPFMCYATISGIVPADAPLELRQDADATNNRLRFKLFWQNGRWQQSKPETY